jgi:hypothetical protein
MYQSIHRNQCINLFIAINLSIYSSQSIYQSLLPPPCPPDAESVRREVGEYLSHHGSVLHGGGVYITALRDCLMDAAIDTQRWSDAAQHAQDNVPPYR